MFKGQHCKYPTNPESKLIHPFAHIFFLCSVDVRNLGQQRFVLCIKHIWVQLDSNQIDIWSNHGVCCIKVLLQEDAIAIYWIKLLQTSFSANVIANCWAMKWIIVSKKKTTCQPKRNWRKCGDSNAPKEVEIGFCRSSKLCWTLLSSHYRMETWLLLGEVNKGQ